MTMKRRRGEERGEIDSKSSVIRGEHRLAVGLASPRVNRVSCRRWMVATPPLATTAFSMWKNMPPCVSFSATSFSFISFRMSTASDGWKER
ncbi:hypothetical protein EYF80_025439 [Liparis tanakae]|uniref:Uncharacterized protein n=1 Tax=Liparis tanakae TaxID=230148 RepID=A0A4Z2HEQ7_9TELE|nr:hypothetical protein EYF80_025439 [Liparis tanakae]